MVSLRLSGSSTFSVIRDMPISAVDRACPVGGEGERVDLVTNGPSTYSYSPAHDHYWFSSAPSEGCFSDYYRTQWGRFAPAPAQKPLKSLAKSVLGPLLPLARPLKAALLPTPANAQRTAWNVSPRPTCSGLSRPFRRNCPLAAA